MTRMLALPLLLIALLAAAPPPTAEERAAAARAIGTDLGRYMEEQARNGGEPCAPVATPLENWQGFPVERCVYRAVTPEHPLLVVYMLNAAPDRLAAWVASGCVAAGLRGDPHCYANLAAHIRGASGYQFPVSGLVDESDDEEVCPSHLCYLTFRDGIAVDLRTLIERKMPDHPTERVLRRFNLETDEIQVRDGPVCRPGAYARIASTSVADLVSWLRDHPDDRGLLALSAGSAAWLDAQVAGGQASAEWPETAVIRLAYQLAWSSDRNILIDAWAGAHRACLASARGCRR